MRHPLADLHPLGWVMAATLAALALAGAIGTTYTTGA